MGVVDFGPVTSILHLSLPVRDLGEARAFYVETLGCRLGRVRDDWMDVWFWGLQLTLHERPDQVTPTAEHDVRHFGVSLEPDDFTAIVRRLRRADTVDGLAPLEHATDPRLSGKTSVKLADPSGNVIELKSYADWGELLDGGD
jgi:uncharacterized protein